MHSLPSFGHENEELEASFNNFEYLIPKGYFFKYRIRPMRRAANIAFLLLAKFLHDLLLKLLKPWKFWFIQWNQKHNDSLIVRNADILQTYFLTFVRQLLLSLKKYSFFYKIFYNAPQKHESTLLHTYVLNEFLTADRLSITRYFWKNSYRSW